MHFAKIHKNTIFIVFMKLRDVRRGCTPSSVGMCAILARYRADHCPGSARSPEGISPNTTKARDNRAFACSQIIKLSPTSKHCNTAFIRCFNKFSDKIEKQIKYTFSRHYYKWILQFILLTFYNIIKPIHIFFRY